MILGPFWDHNPNGMTTDSAVFAQVTAVCPCMVLYYGHPFPPELPLPMGGNWTPSNTWFLGSIQSYNPNCISIGSAVFAQMTTECPLYNGMPLSPLKIAPSHGISGSPSNTWFRGPSQVLNPNGISIGSAVLQGSLVWQTDWQTTLLGR